MKKNILIFVLIIFLTSCAKHINVNECLPMETPSGFWSGTFHGFIMIPSFICSIIWDDVAIYDINNNGIWYNFGFIGGFFMILNLIFKTFTILLDFFKK